ncbi:MAG: hypothetical protein BM485_08550 [Desulfobulbaceae bacterium DB1]|nr:MAG: hypothetical protein BM485_08550 [Desulfobulbaceae bacterium DB1]
MPQLLPDIELRRHRGRKKRLYNSVLFLFFSHFLPLLIFLSPLSAHGIQEKPTPPVRFSLSRLGGPLLDPHRVQGDLELHLNPNLFEGLLKTDAATGELIPALATAWQWINPQTIEFSLRKNVFFHNGEPFDAEAVRFSFERMAAVTEGFNWIKAIIPEYRRVEILNPHRVRIHFKKHNSIFLISSRFFVMLPPGLLRAQGDEAFMHHPVGTGPFAVDSIEYDNHGNVSLIRMIKNPRYWDARLPKIDRLDFHFGLNQQESLKQLLAGKLDAIADLPIRQILSAKKAGFDVRKKGQGLISWIYFNLTGYKRDTPIWSNKVRRAVLHAIDYEKILKIVYRDRARVNHQWAFPGLPGSVEELGNYDYNPELARKLLTESGYGKPFSLNMYCDDVSLDEAKIVKSSLARIGITVNIDRVDEATNNGILESRRKPDSPYNHLLKKYDFMIGDFGWGMPHNYVSHLHTFSLESFVSLVDEDYPDAQNTKIMFADALHSYGEDAANRKWQEITAYELDRLSIAGLVVKDTYYAVRPDLIWMVYGAYDFSQAAYRLEK